MLLFFFSFFFFFFFFLFLFVANPFPFRQVFQYFASVKHGEESFMTAEDFVRAITPYTPSCDGFVVSLCPVLFCSLLIDSLSLSLFSASEDKKFTLPASFARVMAVADPNGDGLISFAEYVFFTSLLSIPQK